MFKRFKDRDRSKVQADHIDIHDPRVLCFHNAAQAYCDLIDEMRAEAAHTPYTRLLQTMSALSGAALELPFDMPDNEIESPHLTHEQWKPIALEIGQAISDTCTRLIANHSMSDHEAEVRVSMLWDDLADIYRDLSVGLKLYKTGQVQEVAEAIWQWRFDYEHHWGYHLYRALQTVHEIRYSLYEE